MTPSVYLCQFVNIVESDLIVIGHLLLTVEDFRLRLKVILSIFECLCSKALKDSTSLNRMFVQHETKS